MKSSAQNSFAKWWDDGQIRGLPPVRVESADQRIFSARVRINLCDHVSGIASALARGGLDAIGQDLAAVPSRVPAIARLAGIQDWATRIGNYLQEPATDITGQPVGVNEPVIHKAGRWKIDPVRPG